MSYSGNATIKAAIVETVGEYGGLDYIDAQLVLHLRTIGVDAKLHTGGLGKFEGRLAGNAYDVYREVYAFKGLRRLMLFAAAFIRSVIYIVRDRSRLVHFHVFEYRLLECLLIFAFRLIGRRVVLSLHDVESFDGVKNSKYSSVCVKMADQLIVHNKYSKRVLLAKYPNASEKVNTVPHGDFTDRREEVVGKNVARERLNIPAGEKVILFFGQIKKTKGLETLIRACNLVLDSGKSVRVVIAGRPWRSDFSEFRSLIEAGGHPNRFDVRLEFVPDEALPSYFSAADLIALPYTEIYQSGVLILAMSLGCPVIVSDIPAMTEYVEDRVNGFVFEEGNWSDLADQIGNVVYDEHLLNRVSEAAFDFIKENNSWNQVATQTKEVYKKALV